MAGQKNLVVYTDLGHVELAKYIEGRIYKVVFGDGGVGVNPDKTRSDIYHHLSPNREMLKSSGNIVVTRTNNVLSFDIVVPQDIGWGTVSISEYGIFDIDGNLLFHCTKSSADKTDDNRVRFYGTAVI